MDEWGHGYSPYFHIFYIFVHLLSSFLLMNYVSYLYEGSKVYPCACPCACPCGVDVGWVSKNQKIGYCNSNKALPVLEYINIPVRDGGALMCAPP